LGRKPQHMSFEGENLDADVTNKLVTIIILIFQQKQVKVGVCGADSVRNFVNEEFSP